MSNETVEFNSHPLDSVDTIEDSIVDEAVVIVEEERPALTGYELVADMMRHHGHRCQVPSKVESSY